MDRTSLMITGGFFALIIVCIIVGVIWYIIFYEKEPLDNLYLRQYQKEKRVRINGAFQNKAFKDGTYGVVVTSGAKVLNADSPIIATSNPSIIADISKNEALSIKVVNLTTKQSVEWMNWGTKITPEMWDKLDHNNFDIYLTEGGIFTNKEMKPFTEFYFSKKWDPTIKYALVKMEFPNGQKPHNNTVFLDDNTIAVFEPSKPHYIVYSYGIPIGSKLSLELRKKDDQSILADTFVTPKLLGRLYVDEKHGITMVPVVV
jgi:hypothetical protein